MLKKIEEQIRLNKQRAMQDVWDEKLKLKNTGPKGVTEPDLPNITEFFEDEEACAEKHDKEMGRFKSEKQEQLEILFL